MTIRNLEYAARPQSVAVIGASRREGSVGNIVMRNIIEGGFAGDILPVNPKYGEVWGRPCHRSVAALPGPADLAVIATPPDTVPGVVAALGEKGTRAAVVITAGLTRENGLRQAMLDAAKPHMLRLIGPNTVGLIVPPARLNASFAHMAPAEGGLALLSQSGAIATSLVDWAAEENVGFSHIVSLGDMADVDVGDYLDMLAGDARTRAILMYLESIPNPAKFMSAARAAARIKPVIAIKSGRHEQSARAAATHTGALSGADRVVDAALMRAGILRVKELAELFHAAEILARFRPVEHARVGIVTNGGGAGVLTLDRLIDRAGALAELSETTMATLDAALPANWSRANPVDIIGDAPAERYAHAVAAVAADPGVDALLVLNCPTGLASPIEAAEAVAGLASKGTISGKPVLTCWLGAATARGGRHLLQNAGVASFETPDDAATAVGYLYNWSQRQRALTRVPSSGTADVAGDRERVLAIFRKAAAEGRRVLTEPEAKAAVEAYGIAVPKTVVAETPEAVEEAAATLLATGGRLVVKLVSKAISHKSDVGGVVLGLETAAAAREAAEAIGARVAKARPDADIQGFAVQPMVERRHAHEVIVGLSRDPIFGPVILFGAGGTAVEVVADTAVALPPLDDVLAGDVIDRTRIGRLLAGYRDRAPADRAALLRTLNAVSRMIVDLPCLASMDINPLIADANGVVALDARIEIAPDEIDRPAPNPDLAIRPYPEGWDQAVELDGHRYLLRPVKPADVALYPPFVDKLSAHDIRLRFLAPRKHFPDQMLLRLTQLDYARDMAFVALEADGGALAGIARLSCAPDGLTAEYGLIVRTDLQGHGLGWALLARLIDYARATGIGTIEGMILSENVKMLAMCREFGFKLSRHPNEPGLSLARLTLN
ncbi:bifunctional acetate--CoA ligase family protein/GNAT family N-acetyltransferase [Aquibium sp. A9E412]|uniref:bifunctional acetate--CoA ligase family protein/GNAT family N-acetyltransferase n=1 Tax=Aquibium sp. A9E412 TaxID=2976767 RepID=UPI0025AFBC89|nr:bifunctional acetate--CoA ligase family protein/GNAT family N-acetyltransferase [Aquibium sp. A9E412]MDN2566672.1 bifunctional acetate--CoA ligase family protein/GNAT family N-acetyltransferase [Aquibium sp. A9E412]